MQAEARHRGVEHVRDTGHVAHFLERAEHEVDAEHEAHHHRGESQAVEQDAAHEAAQHSGRSQGDEPCGRVLADEREQAAHRHDGHGGDERRQEPHQDDADGEGLAPARSRGDAVESRERRAGAGTPNGAVEHPVDP